MQQRAVVIGVEDYASPDFHALPATTRDALAVARLLSSEDNDAGMSVRLCTRDSIGTSRALIEAEIESALSSDASLVVIYFSGHGTLSRGGDYGQLVVSDGRLDMYWLMARIHAHNGRYRSTVVILDCCHAGAMGAPQLDDLPEVEIERGVTILAASDSAQAALESTEHGVFSQLLIQGLEGACADQGGRVTPALLYTYIDQAMGTKDQRPVFATNIQRSPVLKHYADRASDELTRAGTGTVTASVATSATNPNPVSEPVSNPSLPSSAEKSKPVKPSGVLAGVAAGVLIMLGGLGVWTILSGSGDSDGAQVMVSDSASQVTLSDSLQRINALAQAPQLPTFVVIPAGQFTQGNENAVLGKDQAPAKRVAVTEFLMSTTEITLGQYREFNTDTNVLAEPYQTDKHPVVHVSWHDAQVYTTKLEQHYRDAGVAVQCSLPTESEWEYAARAGSDTTWHWGEDQNVAETHAWLASNAVTETGLQSQAVGQKQANDFGLYDTSGNVWEWVDDCYGSYENEPPVASWLQTDATENASCQRVRRGGAFDNHVVTLTPSQRGSSPPETARNSIGFRVACRSRNQTGD